MVNWLNEQAPTWLPPGTNDTTVKFDPVADVVRDWFNSTKGTPTESAPTAEEEGIITNTGFSQVPTKPPITRASTMSLADLPLQYNVGMVLPAYHGSSLPSLTNQGTDFPVQVGAGDLRQQFAKVGQNKGMITTWIPKDPSSVYVAIPYDEATGEVRGNVHEGRFGFQFHYNPNQVSMTYTGQPQVDLGFTATGKDPFHPAGSASTQSTIKFDLLINRMLDHNFYDPESKQLKAGSQDVYGRTIPMNEANRIYEYGTMYDIEYLLAACLGYKMDTQLRGLTADIGYASGRPIELYLGNGMKYFGMVGGVNVTHERFHQNMVPIMSTVSISVNIIPDLGSM